MGPESFFRSCGADASSLLVLAGAMKQPRWRRAEDGRPACLPAATPFLTASFPLSAIWVCTLLKVTGWPENAGERTRLAVAGFARTDVARDPFKRTSASILYHFPQTTRRLDNASGMQSGSAGLPPAVRCVPHRTRRTATGDRVPLGVRVLFRGTRNTAGGTPALPKTRRPDLCPIICERWYYDLLE